MMAAGKLHTYTRVKGDMQVMVTVCISHKPSHFGLEPNLRGRFFSQTVHGLERRPIRMSLISRLRYINSPDLICPVVSPMIFDGNTQSAAHSLVFRTSNSTAIFSKAPHTVKSVPTRMMLRNKPLDVHGTRSNLEVVTFETRCGDVP